MSMTYFTRCFSVSTVDFEQVNTGWTKNVFIVGFEKIFTPRKKLSHADYDVLKVQCRFENLPKSLSSYGNMLKISH